MGYTTDFNGGFKLSKPLTKKQFDYLEAFSQTRRMKRDVNKLMELYKGKGGFPETSPKKNTPKEIYGIDGQFFVGATGYAGQDTDASVIDYNQPPGQKPYAVGFTGIKKHPNKGKNQPGLWCQWVVEGDDEQELKWDGGEKFYNYVEWLRYLIENFFTPWKVKLNGEVEWFGEDPDDRGKIVIKDNVVKVFNAEVSYKEEK